MMRTFSLALRNLLRNRRRSLTTLLAMVVGLTSILLFGGYRSNITYGIETGFIQGSGHGSFDQWHFELVALGGLRIREQPGHEGFWAARQFSLRFLDPPRLGGNAANRDSAGAIGVDDCGD